MSYKIKFDDITSVQVESQKTMNAWGEAINNLNTAMTDFINNTNMKVTMRVRIWLPLRNF